MDLETAHFKSVPLDRRNAILGHVLRARRAKLWKFWNRLTSPSGSESLSPLGLQVQAYLSAEGPILNSAMHQPSRWLGCDKDFWSCLLAIAMAQKLECTPADSSPPPLPLTVLKKLSGEERFEALRARYRCPLNISLASELPIAEELLRQLMVVERVNVEQGSAFDVDSVLLVLNLVGIRALVTRDLRSFDALNYFYELPRSALIRLRVNPRLFAFWLCIYAQLLSEQDWLRCG